MTSTPCYKCQSRVGGGRCYECEEYFCHHHIWGKMLNRKMKDNETGRDVCDSCKEEHNYYSL